MIQETLLWKNIGEVFSIVAYVFFFWEEVTKAPSKEEVLPVISTAKHYLIHIYRNDLFFLSVVNAEFPPLLVLEFFAQTY